MKKTYVVVEFAGTDEEVIVFVNESYRKIGDYMNCNYSDDEEEEKLGARIMVRLEDGTLTSEF